MTFTIKQLKTLVLSFLLWIPFAILLTRIDERNDMGIYTLRFLNMLIGILTWLLCVCIAHAFTKNNN